jgi:hypothetical protein
VRASPALELYPWSCDMDTTACKAYTAAKPGTKVEPADQEELEGTMPSMQLQDQPRDQAEAPGQGDIKLS